MNFLAPAAFLFALLIPVLIVLYLLKRKRTPKLISSTLLWQKYLAEMQANSPFQKLRFNWLMILQLLLLCLVILALARPFFQGNQNPARLRVLILDTSASMQCKDVEPSRIQSAQRMALEMVQSLKDDEQIMVLSAGSTTEVRQSPTSDKAALRKAIESCAAMDGPTRMLEALQTASAFVYEKKGEEQVATGEIHLFSDGAIPALTELKNKNLPLIYHRMGAHGENAGITALDVRANPENAKERAIFVTVQNSGTNGVMTQLELAFEGQVIDVKPVEIPPTNTVSMVFIADQERDGVFQVRLLSQDILDVDNKATIYSHLPRPVRVQLVTRGNRFLEKALRGVPRLTLQVLSQWDPAGTPDVVVLDDVFPSPWPSGNTFAIRVAHTNWNIQSQFVKNASIVDWKQHHPLMRYVNLDNVDLAEGIVAEPQPWATPIILSTDKALAWSGELQRQRIVWLGFDPLQSNWPLRISFPIFIANCMEWLNPASMRASLATMKPGEVLRLQPETKVPDAMVRLPDGSERRVEADPKSGEFLLVDTMKAGAYSIRYGTNQTVYCVSLLDASESQVQPRDTLPVGKYESIAATAPQKASIELWRWSAALALLILMGEWWYFHRRTA